LQQHYFSFFFSLRCLRAPQNKQLSKHFRAELLRQFVESTKLTAVTWWSVLREAELIAPFQQIVYVSTMTASA
jgi:hypothetical protein